MKKWSEKTIVEKVADIISCIALCVWLIFERVEGDGIGYGSCISILVVCVCQAVSFWKVKRAFSYVAIAGAVLLTATLVLLTL